MKSTDIIRLILTSCIIYGAYAETGIFTASSFILIAFALEENGFMWRKLKKEED